MKSSPQKDSRAFTLIELLVVIAIIAILAAILFPVFAQARSKARQITGTSNIKQLALTVLMYSQDYDEKFPEASENDRREVCWYFLNVPNVGAITCDPTGRPLTASISVSSMRY